MDNKYFRLILLHPKVTTEYVVKVLSLRCSRQGEIRGAGECEVLLDCPLADYTSLHKPGCGGGPTKPLRPQTAVEVVLL
ncbi:hypothetical protein J6590_041815 [Homalodisca vitripennis]|nr:hypothetical protein J6590_041815 [Homalodisca vitripennis]